MGVSTILPWSGALHQPRLRGVLLQGEVGPDTVVVGKVVPQQATQVDFFTVPTVTFKVLFVFVVLAHDRRRVVHCNVTEAHRRRGRPSRSWRCSHGRPPDDTSCATAMRSTGSCSPAESKPWASAK
jgi:hypothetical protein